MGTSKTYTQIPSSKVIRMIDNLMKKHRKLLNDTYWGAEDIYSNMKKYSKHLKERVREEYG